MAFVRKRRALNVDEIDGRLISQLDKGFIRSNWLEECKVKQSVVKYYGSNFFTSPN